MSCTKNVLVHRRPFDIGNLNTCMYRCPFDIGDLNKIFQCELALPTSSNVVPNGLRNILPQDGGFNIDSTLAGFRILLTGGNFDVDPQYGLW